MSDDLFGDLMGNGAPKPQKDPDAAPPLPAGEQRKVDEAVAPTAGAGEASPVPGEQPAQEQAQKAPQTQKERPASAAARQAPAEAAATPGRRPLREVLATIGARLRPRSAPAAPKQPAATTKPKRETPRKRQGEGGKDRGMQWLNARGVKTEGAPADVVAQLLEGADKNPLVLRSFLLALETLPKDVSHMLSQEKVWANVRKELPPQGPEREAYVASMANLAVAVSELLKGVAAAERKLGNAPDIADALQKLAKKK